MTVAVALLVTPIPLPIGEFKFELIDQHIVLRTMMGEQSLRTVLDTGAQASILDLSFVPPTAKRSVIEVRGTTGASAGWQIKGMTVWLDTIKVPVRFGFDLHELSEGSETVDALLGFDFLKNYVVEFDYPASVIRLYSPKDSLSFEGEKPIPMRLKRGRPVVKGWLKLPRREEKPVEIMIDTGGHREIDVTNRMVRREGWDRAYEAVPTSGVGRGIGGDAEGKTVEGAEIRLGEATFTGQAVLTMTEAGSMGKGSDYDVHLGGDFLRKSRLVIDYPRSRVYFRPAGIQ